MIVVMDEVVIYIALLLLGLCAGSFAGASVWRLRARELRDDKHKGLAYDKGEYEKLTKVISKSIMSDRSKCLNCSYTLKWFDMIPVISWLYLRGKCRKCGKSIGITEPLLELGLALFFFLSYMFWPLALSSTLDVAIFITWLISGVGLAMLFVYDLKWFMLPDKVNYSVIGLAAIGAVLGLVSSSDLADAISAVAVSVMILSGLYYALYSISKGQWVGFGDVKLGIGLALLLADWKLAFIALFIANLIGSLIVVPLMLSGKLKRDAHIPLGPLLIVGTIVAKLAGTSIVDWYINTLL